MTISPLREIVILSSSFLSGVVIGIIYDIMRRIKRLFGLNSLLVDIGDVITFLLLSICAYCSVYIINDGKVRWYEIFGIFSGFYMYKSVVSHYVIKLLEFLEGMIRGAFIVIKKLLTPVAKLVLWMSAGVKKVFGRIKIRIS